MVQSSCTKHGGPTAPAGLDEAGDSDHLWRFDGTDWVVWGSAGFNSGRVQHGLARRPHNG